MVQSSPLSGTHAKELGSSYAQSSADTPAAKPSPTEKARLPISSESLESNQLPLGRLSYRCGDGDAWHDLKAHNTIIDPWRPPPW